MLTSVARSTVSLRLPFNVVLHSTGSLEGLMMIHGGCGESSNVSLVLLWCFARVVSEVFSVIKVGFRLVSICVLTVLFGTVREFLVF